MTARQPAGKEDLLKCPLRQQEKLYEEAVQLLRVILITAIPGEPIMTAS